MQILEIGIASCMVCVVLFVFVALLRWGERFVNSLIGKRRFKALVDKAIASPESLTSEEANLILEAATRMFEAELEYRKYGMFFRMMEEAYHGNISQQEIELQWRKVRHWKDPNRVSDASETAKHIWRKLVEEEGW